MSGVLNLAFLRAGRIARPKTLFMLIGLPLLEAKIGPDSGFPQCIRCPSNILASGRMIGTAPLL